MSSPDIVLIEDNPALSTLYSELLTDDGYSVRCFRNGQLGLDATLTNHPRLLLLDLELPDQHGFEILRKLRRADREQQVAILSGHASAHMAAESLRQGAQHYIEKPNNIHALSQRIRELLTPLQNPRRLAENDCAALQAIWGESAAMQSVFQRIKAAGSAEAPVFITGETGTGKELCARAIHHMGVRAKAPFIAVNCGAVPKELFESEFFGHERGAFSGAIRDRKGVVEQAHGGTLFLDELGELPMDQQVKLLRFLQTGEFRRLGDTQTRSADVRILTATHRNPEWEIANGTLREDLFYRLHVIPMHLPPLRERGTDVLVIAERLLAELCKGGGKHFRGFSGDVQAWLMQHPWPGNVRQLQNVLRGVVALHDGEWVTPSMIAQRDARKISLGAVLAPLPKSSPTALAAPPLVAPANPRSVAGRSLMAVERELIEATLQQHNGNVQVAAAQLEISVSTIYRKKKEWEAAGLSSEPLSGT